MRHTGWSLGLMLALILVIGTCGYYQPEEMPLTPAPYVPPTPCAWQTDFAAGTRLTTRSIEPQSGHVFTSSSTGGRVTVSYRIERNVAGDIWYYVYLSRDGITPDDSTLSGNRVLATGRGPVDINGEITGTPGWGGRAPYDSRFVISRMVTPAACAIIAEEITPWVWLWRY